jgi:hypothetical protein
MNSNEVHQSVFTGTFGQAERTSFEFKGPATEVMDPHSHTLHSNSLLDFFAKHRRL